MSDVNGWRDVDEVVAAQQQAEREKALLRATLDSLLDPHVLARAVRDDRGEIVDFEYIDANDAACAYNTRTLDELVGLRLTTLWAGEAGLDLFEHYVHTVETGIPLVLDDYVYPDAAGGATRVYDIRAVKVGDALSYTFRDVTDAWQVRRALEEAIDMRRRIGEIAKISGSEVDLRTGQRTWLPESMTILDLDELPGPDMGLHNFLSAESLTIVQAAVKEGIANGSTWSVEVPAVTAKGREIWLRILGSADTADGRATIVHGAFQDVTDRKRAEAERISLENQLRQAAKMESVGRLAGGVAHDFNNMLGVILGRAELALSRLDPADPVHADLAEIHRAAQRSADLTQQLLAFARQQTVEPKLMDLNRVVAGMLGMLRRLIGEDVPVVWHPDGEVWPIRIDPSQIDQVVTNLCLNGRDAIIETSRSNGVVEITTANVVIDEAFCNRHPEARPGEFVRLCVADNGDGMTSHIAAQIFEPFFTTKDIGSGTGLGLATVHGAVTQNDGFIVVSSRPGVGTTFQVHLPRQNTDSETDPAVTLSIPKLRRGKETVLVVEDEPSLLRLIARVLVAHDYEVLSAGGVTEAIELAGAHADEIALVVTDVVMPNVNGRELVETLTLLGLRAKHLFMSGYPADVIARRGVLDTGVAFIQKPFSMDDLLAKIGEVLDRADE